jgi:Ca2+-binding RTX toxin-like protein
VAGGNAQITHLCAPDLHPCAQNDPGKWASNVNDHAFVRTIQLLNPDTSASNTGPITAGIGGGDVISGGPGDDHLYGGNGNDQIDGGPGADYAEGGSGSDLMSGAGGDDDLIGGSSPTVFTGSASATDAAAGSAPDGSNIICGFECGRSMTPGMTADPATGSDTTDADVIVADNGRIDRCAAVVSGAVGTPQGSDRCTWQSTDYGSEKASSFPNGTAGGAQAGTLCTAVGPGCPVVSLGSARTRFTTLLGQDPAETTHNGNGYIEGNGGNDVIYGEDGSDVVHGDTPAQTAQAAGLLPAAGYPQYGAFNATFQLANECLPTSDPQAGQDIITGGYGNDLMCGDGGDDGILGNRGLVGAVNGTGVNAGAVTPVPFSNKTRTIGSTSGGPFGLLTTPTSGNTIYPARLDVEYVDGLLVPVPTYNTGAQASQHDIIFGGQGNDTMHGSPGDDFLQGDDGIHIQGQPASTGGDDIVFGGGGNDSLEGGPGDDHLIGGNNNDDQDVIRSDAAIAPKVDETGACLPMAFPTLTVDPSSLGTANGYCNRPGSWANVSYASRFPAPAGMQYGDPNGTLADPGATDNGGETTKTQVFGDIMYGGFNRDISQSQGTAPGYGDRIIDSLGAYNLEFVCPAAYGGSQIIRSLSPTMLTFLQQLGTVDGAYNVNQTSKPPATNSSGDNEMSIVYPSLNVPDNGGSAYPTTAGHFTC